MCACVGVTFFIISDSFSLLPASRKEEDFMIAFNIIFLCSGLVTLNELPSPDRHVTAQTHNLLHLIKRKKHLL